MSKSLFRSKTFWVNVLTAAGAIAAGQFGVIIPPEIAVTVLAVVNVALRLVTFLPVTVLGDGK